MSVVSQKEDGTFVKEPSPLEKSLYQQLMSNQNAVKFTELDEQIANLVIGIREVMFAVDNLVKPFDLGNIDAIRLNGHPSSDYVLVEDLGSLSNKAVSLMPINDGDYSGELSKEYVSIDTSIGSLLYLTIEGYALSKASDITYLPCVAIATETAAAGDRVILKKGYLKNIAWNFTKGALLYVSPTVAGSITSIKPTAGLVQIIGYAVDSKIIYFNPQYNQ